jgi:hypothetical protein
MASRESSGYLVRLDVGAKPLPSLEQIYIKSFSWLLLPSKQISIALNPFRVGCANG